MRFEPTPPDELITTSGAAAAGGLVAPPILGSDFTDSGLASPINIGDMLDLMAADEPDIMTQIRDFRLPDDWFLDEYAFEGDFFFDWDGFENPFAQPTPFYQQQNALVAEEYYEEASSLTMGEAMLYAFYMALGLIFASLVARLLYIEIALRPKVPKDNREAVLFSFYKIVKYMRFFDYEIMPNETAKVFATRVSKRVGFENDKVFMLDIAEVFARARYSNMEINDADRDLLLSAEKSLNARLKRHIGRPRYLFYKYIGASWVI